MADVVEILESLAPQLFPEGQGVLVAVSGGVDSMALLHALHQISDGKNRRLVVAHFNHQLRRNASKADQRLVEKTANQFGLKCICKNWAKDPAAIKQHGLEMAARTDRLAFLARVARRHHCPIVAMAHHRDDQAETFLWRMMRGAGGQGLGGMRALEKFPGHPAIQIGRPFLEMAKADLRQFAQTNNFRFREDTSNKDPRHLRNRIRHDLLPCLRKIFNPEIEKSILQSQDLVRADADFARTVAQEWLDSDRNPPFAALHPSLQRWVIWHQLIELKIEPQFEHIRLLIQQPAQPVTLNPGQILQRNEDGTLQSITPAQLNHDHAQAHIVPSLKWTEHQLASTRIRCRVAARKPKSTQGEMFDAGLVGREILLRHWQPGDRFQPIGLPQSVKLQDLFTNAKVAAAEKRRRVLACTGEGQIFWVQGLRIGELAKMRPSTNRFLNWICSPL